MKISNDVRCHLYQHAYNNTYKYVCMLYIDGVGWNMLLTVVVTLQLMSCARMHIDFEVLLTADSRAIEC